jgi:hypothetical protein
VPPPPSQHPLPLWDPAASGVSAGSGPPGALAGREAVVARTAAALAAHGDLDDAEYCEAAAELGPDGLFELLTLVGYYATLALQLRVFRVPAPAETPFPPPPHGPQESLSHPQPPPGLP